MSRCPPKERSTHASYPFAGSSTRKVSNDSNGRDVDVRCSVVRAVALQGLRNSLNRNQLDGVTAVLREGDGNDVRNALVDCRNPVADRCDPELAAQQELGIWTQRCPRSRRARRGTAGGDGADLTAADRFTM